MTRPVLNAEAEAIVEHEELNMGRKCDKVLGHSRLGEGDAAVDTVLMQFSLDTGLEGENAQIHVQTRAVTKASTEQHLLASLLSRTSKALTGRPRTGDLRPL